MFGVDVFYGIVEHAAITLKNLGVISTQMMILVETQLSISQKLKLIF